MSSKLSAANPYLRDPVMRARMVFTSVASSSAIEGIHAPFRKMAHAAATAGTVATKHSKSKRKISLIPVKF